MTTSARSSPPTERVVRVLNQLASEPARGYGLSDLARSTGLSKATCLGVVTSLVDAGYLIRNDRDKTYRLGPALVSLGRAARRSLRAAPVAHLQISALAQRFGAPVSLSALASDRVSVLNLAVPDGSGAAASLARGAAVKAGDSFPATPGARLMYVLFDRAGAFDRWRAQSGYPQRLSSMVAQWRRDGYLVELRTEAARTLHRAFAGNAAPSTEELQDVLRLVVADFSERVLVDAEFDSGADGGEIGSGEVTYSVSVVSAPVFNSKGAQTMLASLYLDKEIEAQELRRLATDFARSLSRIDR